MSIWQWFVLLSSGSSTTRILMILSTHASWFRSHHRCLSGRRSPRLFNPRFVHSLPICLFFFQLSTNLPLQVWLATLLSFVIVTVTYALLTRQEGWGKDPRFGFVDSECSLPLISLQNVADELYFTILIWPSYVSLSSSSWLKIPWSPAFVLGTLIDQSQHRLSKLNSTSLRLFTSIWLACILSITVQDNSNQHVLIVLLSPYHPLPGWLQERCDVCAHCADPSSANW